MQYGKMLNNGQRNTGIDVQYATVASVVSGQPFLRFAGETGNSQKAYKFLKSYVPAAGDRVIIVNGVIMGGWR